MAGFEAPRDKDLQEQGFRLVDQEAYTYDGQVLYAGLWVENTEGYGWFSYRNLSSEQFSERFAELKDDYVVIDVEAYSVGSETRYAMVWVENANDMAWREYRDMTAGQFQDRFSQYQTDFRVLEVESYRVNGEQRYAAIWVENENDRGWFTYYGMTAEGWSNRWNHMKDLGFRPIDYEAYETADGVRYAGVWRQNNSRYGWSYRTEVDTLSSSFLADHDTPGLGVTIIQNGQTLYQRGFGHQDDDLGTWYSSNTINRLASVSSRHHE